jgi:hypothetical protein
MSLRGTMEKQPIGWKELIEQIEFTDIAGQ